METLATHQKPQEAKTTHSQYFKSKTVVIIAAVLIEMILLIGAFNLGMKVAFHKARFTYTWMSNYQKNFIPPTGPEFMMNHRPGDPEFMNANGAIGQIIGIKDTGLTIKGYDNNEKKVLINQGTTIRKDFADLKISDLKINDTVIVMGAPNEQGQIEAKLVRVLDQTKQ